MFFNEKNRDQEKSRSTNCKFLKFLGTIKIEDFEKRLFLEKDVLKYGKNFFDICCFFLLGQLC